MKFLVSFSTQNITYFEIRHIYSIFWGQSSFELSTELINQG